jgi:hypothetical protein
MKNIITNSSNNRVILPICNSFLKAWPAYGFLISIILCKKTSYDWLINCLVQTKGIITCASQQSGGRLYPAFEFIPEQYANQHSGIFHYCPFIDYIPFRRDFINKKYSSFVNFLINMLDNGYYASAQLDQFFGPLSYQKFGSLHTNYIYGYDSVSEKIYMADNFDHGKFSFLEASFSEVDKAFSLIDDSKNIYKNEIYKNIHLFQVEDIEYKFDIFLMRDLFREYLDSKPDFGIQYRIFNGNLVNNYQYGFNNYSLFQEYLHELLEGNTDYQVDHRFLSFLIDHKVMMKRRIIYLQENNYIMKSDKILRIFDTIESYSRTALNIFLKYIIAKNRECIERVSMKLEDIQLLEKIALDSVMEDIIHRYPN